MRPKARKTAKRPAAKARTTAATKAKAVTPATPASDLTLFCLKGKVKKLTEKEFSMVITDPVYDSEGYIDEQKSKKGLELWSTTIYTFTNNPIRCAYVGVLGGRCLHRL